MDDTTMRPDPECLFAMASGQHGYFTNEQARRCGYSRALLASHARGKRFRRIRRGLYRLRDYPSSPHEETVVAWLAVGKDVAVVSHESALDLLDLSDIIPNAVHLTVPRSMRYVPNLPGVFVHTATRPPGPKDTVTREGIRLTSPLRTILDAAEAGVAPEQVEAAVRQALARGLVTRDRLAADAVKRSRRVADLVTSAAREICP